MSYHKDTDTTKAADAILVTLWNLPYEDGPETAEDLIEAVAAKTGERYDLAFMRYVLTWIRKHANELGWTVPQQPAGSRGSDRHYSVVVHGTAMSADQSRGVRSGQAAQVKHVITRQKNAVETLRLAMQEAPVEDRWVYQAALQAQELAITVTDQLLTTLSPELV